MLEFTYAGLLRRAGIAPPQDALTAALNAWGAVRSIELDRAAPIWVRETVTAWATRGRVVIRDLVKVGGLPVSGEGPVLVSVPDRVGFVPPEDWEPPTGMVVVSHRFRRDGGLANIEAGSRFDATLGPPLGDRLGKRLRQVGGVRRLEGTAGHWCTFLQPDDPATVLAKMEGAGILAGEPIGLPEYAGGIAAVVPEGASDTDLAHYIAALAAALA